MVWNYVRCLSNVWKNTSINVTSESKWYWVNHSTTLSNVLVLKNNSSLPKCITCTGGFKGGVKSRRATVPGPVLLVARSGPAHKKKNWKGCFFLFSAEERNKNFKDITEKNWIHFIFYFYVFFSKSHNISSTHLRKRNTSFCL